MDDRQFAFLRDLAGAAGPSGYEAPVRAVWRAAAQEFAAPVTTDAHGSITAVVNPGGSPRVMLAGHIDEIGLMVSSIDEKGFLSFVPIGSHDPAVLVGQRVSVHTDMGPVLGVVGRKPIHLMHGDERKEPIEIKKLWIDIGAANGEDAEQAVRVGDAVTMIGALERLRGDLLVSKAFDDRLGAYVAAETARAVSGGPLAAALFAVGTCQEEIGYRGAITSAERIRPDVAIAVDVGFALDHPGLDDEKRQRNNLALGKGPQISRGPNTNPRVFELLTQVAKAEGIPYQVEPAPGETGTDSWAMQVAHHGIPTGVVSVSVRYMHTPAEVASSTDLDHTVALLTAFVRHLDASTTFVVE
jgi:putative aminopeptidase FrvX